ncbi:GIY-YIG nuclease family protein [Azotobacter chroococcum]|uniref:GIY-YIG nuclease family protein n=1 Tax=Azotobacter chroococcum TaxID=353 RepID=UPI0010ADCEA6|nr:GIY-YIG nuclease family protein [Azotobacter chroococcum]TKD32596.1 GIY-YIG nuclease family protein [Azotobacter chroococcum]
MSLPGHVYIAEFSEGVIKVGFSGNPHLRIKQVKMASGRKLESFWASKKVCDGLAFEAQLLAALTEFRVQGEWFSCGFDQAVEAALNLQADHPEWSPEIDEARRKAKKNREDGLISALHAYRLDGIINSCVSTLVWALRLVELREEVALDVLYRDRDQDAPPERAILSILLDRRFCYIHDAGIMCASVVGERVGRAVGWDKAKANELIALISERARMIAEESERLSMSDLDAAMA